MEQQKKRRGRPPKSVQPLPNEDKDQIEFEELKSYKEVITVAQAHHIVNYLDKNGIGNAAAGTQSQAEADENVAKYLRDGWKVTWMMQIFDPRGDDPYGYHLLYLLTKE